MTPARSLVALAAGALALSWWAGAAAVTLCAFGPCDAEDPPPGFPAAAGWHLLDAPAASGISAPRVASDADGDFVVAWLQRATDAQDDASHVYARRFSTLGAARGAAFRVDAWRASDADVAMDAAGNFVVAWTGEPTPDQGRRVFARLYDADGVARGPEIEVDGAGGSRVAAAVDVDGDFVIVWQGEGIQARRYDADGVAQGAPVRVDSPAYAANMPAVAMAPGGAFVVAWHSDYDGADGPDIRARRFDATGAAVGAEFRLNESVADWQQYVTLATDAAGNFIAAWNSGALFGDTDIVMRRFAADGTPLGGDNVLATEVFSRPRAARAATGTQAIIWCTLGFAGAAGQLWRSTDLVLMPESIGGCDAVAADADGDFTAVWEDDEALEALRVGDHDRATVSVDVTEEADPVVAGARFRYFATITNTTAPSTATGYPALDEAIGTASGIWLDFAGDITADSVYANFASTGLVLAPGTSGQGSAEFVLSGPDAAIEGAIGATPEQGVRAEGPSHQTAVVDGTAVQFASATLVADEATTATVTVHREGDLSAASSVDLVAAAGSAGADDFTPFTQPLQWDAGDATGRTVEIALADDALVEGAETIALSLQNPVGATAGTYGKATLVIRDDDPRHISFDAAETRLGEGAAPATIAVKLSRAATEDIAVPFTVLGAPAAGLYALTPSPVTIPAGQTEALLTLAPQDDARDDYAQGFAITLGAPSAGVLGAQREHHVTLLDDDAPPTASFTTAAQSAVEDAGTLSIPVVLSAASDKVIRVGYLVSGSGRLDTTEPHPLSGELEFAPGATDGAITLTLADDGRDEPTEEIVLTLTSFIIGGTPAWTTGALPEHTVAIEDNDAASGGSFGCASLLLALAAFARRAARLAAAALLGGLALTAHAADDAALAQCAAVSVDAARLACYDALAGRPATPSGGAAAPVAVPPVPSEADFGKPPAPRVEPDSIRARIVGATKELKPGVILKLDNGQVWKVSTETGSSYRGIPDDAEVVITKGWLGSYWMEVTAIKRQFKVRRVS